MASDNIEKLLQRAKQAIEARDWDRAKMCYLQALGLKSDLPDVHYGLATVYFALRELTSSAHHFREVTRLDPLRAGAYVNLGAVLNVLNQPDEAIAALRRGIQIDPTRTEGFYNLGLVYRRKNQADLAIQAYREAIRLNPRMADAHLNLANVYYDKGQYRQAEQYYEQALQVRPGWQKAAEGLEQARAAIEAEQRGESPQAPAPAKSAKEDLDRLVDPQAHGSALTTLHQSAIDAEAHGQALEQILQHEVEPVIKELSACLLYPDGARSDLSNCVERFEAALVAMQTLREELNAALTRARQQEGKFI
jgi:Tfp pilus assembly protein PilF